MGDTILGECEVGNIDSIFPIVYFLNCRQSYFVITIYGQCILYIIQV